MIFRIKRTLMGLIIVSGAITLFLGGVVLYWHLADKIVDYYAVIPLLSIGPAFALICCAIILPQKLVWHDGVLQKHVFGHPTWKLNTEQQPLCIQARRIYTGKIYFRLVYRQSGECLKRDMQNYDNIIKLYMLLLPYHNEMLFLENERLFTVDVRESVVSSAAMAEISNKNKN